MIALALLIAILAAGCDFPNDPQGTLDRVRGDTLRVGVMPDPPWITVHGDEVGGSDVAAIEALAGALDAKVQWQPGGESILFNKLERFELDLVIGGITQRSPWSAKVALTKPLRTVKNAHGKQQHVWAMPPGENAWVMHVTSFIAAHRDLFAPAPTGESEPSP